MSKHKESKKDKGSFLRRRRQRGGCGGSQPFSGKHAHRYFGEPLGPWEMTGPTSRTAERSSRRPRNWRRLARVWKLLRLELLNTDVLLKWPPQNLKLNPTRTTQWCVAHNWHRPHPVAGARLTQLHNDTAAQSVHSRKLFAVRAESLTGLFHTSGECPLRKAWLLKHVEDRAATWKAFHVSMLALQTVSCFSFF